MTDIRNVNRWIHERGLACVVFILILGSSCYSFAQGGKITDDLVKSIVGDLAKVRAEFQELRDILSPESWVAVTAKRNILHPEVFKQPLLLLIRAEDLGIDISDTDRAANIFEKSKHASVLRSHGWDLEPAIFTRIPYYGGHAESYGVSKTSEVKPKILKLMENKFKEIMELVEKMQKAYEKSPVKVSGFSVVLPPLAGAVNFEFE